ncbi:hypothetical protein [Acinetobacter bereziniae]|uniref:hypothetical protein n=1 Tax=Acinetobacter bereziniae TaxID=106648 RepID=UPI0018FF65B1|nr:hypothetical protein [Acinetobacter bereziniae]MBJ9902031.1 hypothetical protein [Acinetobacter bereziniae]MCU4317946.1 hypothetical protein [Acinetobacter bereziniae]MCU4597759.1 hypothetical protein [Acinetobacter bereziniae]
MTIQTDEILETAYEITDQLAPFVISGDETTLKLSKKRVDDLYHIAMNFIVINEANDLPSEIEKSLGEVA